MQSHIRRILPLFCLAAAALIATGCSKKDKPDPSKTFAMGSPVSVGPFTYVVTESEWKESLDGGNGSTRLPQDRFLILRLSVSNHSTADAYVPMLTLIDSKGKEHRELDKGDGLSQWLGVLRPLTPSQSETGEILFDVAPGEYSLVVSSGGDAESELTSRVIIPMHVEPSPVKGVDPLSAPPAATK